MIRPMRLYSRNGWWYAEIRRGKSKALKTRDEQTAKGIYKEMEKEYLRGRLLQLDTRRIAVSDLSRLYEQSRAGISIYTVKKDLLGLKLFREAVGNIDLRTITAAKIDQFKTVCLARGAKPQTINGYLRHIKASLSYALENGWIVKKPKVKMIRENRQSMAERIISPENLKKIIEAADPVFSRYLTVLLWTGGRRREVLNLTWHAVDFEAGSVLLTRTKGKRDRRIPLLPGAISALEPVKKDIGRVFPEWHPDTVSKWFHLLAKGIGINARLHDLRHSAAYYLLKSGVPLQVVKEILGHAHLSTTLIYSNVGDEIMKQEMAKMRIE